MRNCTYCHAYLPLSDLTPMYEKNKPGIVRVYCDRCIFTVKSNLKPYEREYLLFGKRGELAAKNKGDAYFGIDNKRTDC